ncbi:hypothetical protein BGZ63DRAFT_399783 [Mariannaea sp. PMI_226]|nr:hypothetical protein BGZ63DRAFT_399783 [Mariannaea sp. PMI_226]
MCTVGFFNGRVLANAGRGWFEKRGGVRLPHLSRSTPCNGMHHEAVTDSCDASEKQQWPNIKSRFVFPSYGSSYLTAFTRQLSLSGVAPASLPALLKAILYGGLGLGGGFGASGSAGSLFVCMEEETGQTYVPYVCTQARHLEELVPHSAPIEMTEVLNSNSKSSRQAFNKAAR